MSTQIFTANSNIQYKYKPSIPSFGVDSIVSCFVEQLDFLSNSQQDNVCMVGIFGAWGRGKTYFLDRIEAFLSKRKENTLPKYTIIRFNAWKYQETPALWAYLYETIKSKNSWWNNTRIFCRENMINIIRVSLLSIFIPIGCLLFEYVKNINLPNWLIWLTPLIPIIERFLKYLYNNKDIWRSIKSNTNHINMLGYQNIVERDLERLLTTWIPKRKISQEKIILHIDDLDRCEDIKMISILDSLRTILENEQIKKRLIVICNIDKDRLKTAISQKYLTNTKLNVSKRLVEEQIDKLFIFSIGLPQLSVSQQKSYVETFIKESVQSEDMIPYDSSREQKSLIATDGKTVEKDISENDLVGLLQEYIANNNTKLTPRQIHIIYYRLIFANRLISSGCSSVYIPHTFIEQIIMKSISCDYEVDINECFSDILEIVVPY